MNTFPADLLAPLVSPVAKAGAGGRRRGKKEVDPCCICLNPSSRRSTKYRWGSCCKKDVDACEYNAIKLGGLELEEWERIKIDPGSMRAAVLKFQVEHPSRGQGASRGVFSFLQFSHKKTVSQGLYNFGEGEYFSLVEWQDECDRSKTMSRKEAAIDWYARQSVGSPAREVNGQTKIGIVLKEKFHLYTNSCTTNEVNQHSKMKKNYSQHDVDEFEKELGSGHGEMSQHNAAMNIDSGNVGNLKYGRLMKDNPASSLGPSPPKAARGRKCPSLARVEGQRKSTTTHVYRCLLMLS